MKGRKNTMLNTKQQEFVDYAVKMFGTNELSVAIKSTTNILVASMHLNG